MKVITDVLTDCTFMLEIFMCLAELYPLSCLYALYLKLLVYRAQDAKILDTHHCSVLSCYMCMISFTSL